MTQDQMRSDNLALPSAPALSFTGYICKKGHFINHFSLAHAGPGMPVGFSSKNTSEFTRTKSTLFFADFYWCKNLQWLIGWQYILLVK